MKKKFKSKLILIFAAIASLLLLGGCKIGESLEEVRENRNLTSQVTYYSNGGNFENDLPYKDIYYAGDSEVFNVGVTGTVNGTATISRANHDFGGWYYAEMSGDEPVFENADDETPKISDTKVEFPLIIDEDEHLYLVAKWLPHVKVQVKLVYFTDQNVKDETPTELITAGGKTYKNGDDLMSYTYDNGLVEKPGTGDYYAPLSNVTGFSFVDYYTESACENALINAWPLVQEEEQEADAVIYAKYIPGEWNIVREKNDIYDKYGAGMLGSNTSDKRYWVAGDIETDLKVNPLQSFDWTIWGNGFTISGLKIDKRNVEGKVSLFGDIKSTAVIKDLTLDAMNIRYTSKTGATAEVFFSFTSMENGATVSGVKLKGELYFTGTSTPRLYGTKGAYTTDEEYEEGTHGEEFTVEKTN